MQRRYSTREGDVVDAIAWQHYGEESPEILIAVFEANPGLADRDPILPAGVTIILPEIQRPANTVKGTALWD
ncbi:TPA: tail protein X [Stenotrophomonas maltophilia]